MLANGIQQPIVNKTRPRVLGDHAAKPVPHRIPAPWATSQRSCPHQQPRGSIISRAEVEEMARCGSYNADINSSVWERRPVPVIARLLKIGSELAAWQLQHPPDNSGPAETASSANARGRRKGDRKRKNSRAAAMRHLLVRLGPAFVKIGQALSSRPDVLPPEYLVELEALQDRIPAFDSKEAFAVIESEFGAPLATIFSQISPEPVAAASLGQVYKARLARDGSEVAVKVQRPGVADAIALDVYILRWLAAAFRNWRKLNTDLPALVDEWATSLFRELDYRREAANAERFKQLYSQLEGVYVPTVYNELTTTKVMTMEWVDGERLRTVADNLAEEDAGYGMSGRRRSASPGGRQGSDIDLALVEVGVRCSLEQMLEEGFYHADPHPGNLLKTKDGRLCWIDFGMCGQLDQKTRQALIRATLHLVNREYSYLAQDFIDLGLLPPGSDKEKIVPALTGVFQQALARGVSNVSFSDLSGQLGRTMYQFSFRIPPYYTLLVRSLTVLEGIALASDPNYKVLGSAYPWIARRLLTNQTPELRATLRALLYTPAGNFRFTRLESLLQEAVRRPTPLPPPVSVSNGQGLAMSTSSSSSGGGSGNGSGGSALSLLLSPDASFVRNILIDELAKGIDASWRVAIDSAVHNALHPLPTVARVPVIGPLLVPLVAPLTTSSPPWAPWSTNTNTNTSSRSTTADHRGNVVQPTVQEPFLGGPAGAVLAALPQLSSAGDREQLDGLRRLAGAMAALAASRTSTAHGTQSSQASRSIFGPTPSVDSHRVSSSSPGSFGVQTNVFIEPADAATQMQDVANSLRWLVQELNSLPEAQRLEALKLPSELAAQVASRMTARAIRSVFAPESDAAAQQIKQESTALLLPAASNPDTSIVMNGMNPSENKNAVQDVLAGSSIV